MLDDDLAERRFQRERAARKAAESLLEQKSRELYEANEHLTALADQLREQAEQTKGIVEAAAEGIITYDQNGNIFLFNRSARRIFALNTVTGRNVRELFESSNRTNEALFPSTYASVSVLPPHAATEADVEVHEAIECVGLRNAKTPFAAEVSTSRTTFTNAVVFTTLVRDLSRRKKLEARLNQAQKMESVGQLASGIAHEINTPIQFIGDNLQFIQSTFADLSELISSIEDIANAQNQHHSCEALINKVNKKKQDIDFPFLQQEFPVAIQQSLDGIERVAKIVRALKEFSQPSSDQWSAVDINRAIENSLTVLASRLSDHITVNVSLQEDLQPVVCLGGHLNQSLLNILSNAIEAIAEHCEPGTGRIEISTKREGDSIEIRFTDNGPGIPAEIQSRIFDPFFTTKEVGKGSGQGLAFVYDVVVNKHSGSIHALSPPAGGTTFVVSLPFAGCSSSKGREHAVTIG